MASNSDGDVSVVTDRTGTGFEPPDDTDRYEDETEKRFAHGTGEEDTVRCDNCYRTVDASASTCPACGADLDGGSGWSS